MKPMNFPGRKLERRKKALANLPKDADATHRATLEKRTAMRAEQARGIRTKQNRTTRAGIR